MLGGRATDLQKITEQAERGEPRPPLPLLLLYFVKPTYHESANGIEFLSHKDTSGIEGDSSIDITKPIKLIVLIFHQNTQLTQWLEPVKYICKMCRLLK